MQDDPRYEVFRNHFGENMTYYGYLTPEEAKQEMRERKEIEGFIPQEDYWGYMDVIESAKDDKYLDKFSTMTTQEIHRWFMRKRNAGSRISTNMYEEVWKRVAPFQEPDILAMLEEVEPKKVASWVADMKNKGYFFTDYAYKVCREKFDTRPQSKKKPSKVKSEPVIANEPESEPIKIEESKPEPAWVYTDQSFDYDKKVKDLQRREEFVNGCLFVLLIAFVAWVSSC